MSELMILPSTDHTKIRLVQIPEDFESHECYRYVTGLIAGVEEEDENFTIEDVEAILEEKGFEFVEFIMGPEID